MGKDHTIDTRQPGNGNSAIIESLMNHWRTTSRCGGAFKAGYHTHRCVVDRVHLDARYPRRTERRAFCIRPTMHRAYCHRQDPIALRASAAQYRPVFKLNTFFAASRSDASAQPCSTIVASGMARQVSQDVHDRPTPAWRPPVRFAVDQGMTPHWAKPRGEAGESAYALIESFRRRPRGRCFALDDGQHRGGRTRF